ncbi:hypothetical protein Q3G72_024565 [Acer saccharum]|nr:hypothetical protein Q3G72_024565 [Acer saccharum]
MGKLAALLFSSLALTTIFSFFVLYSPNPLKNFTKRDPDDDHHQKHSFIKPDHQKEKENCDLFKGHWEEIPIDAYKDPEDRHRIWYFANHDFTLTILWSKFLVHGNERMINGSSSGIFDLHLDKVDDKWARHLPIIDYAIISNAHWFFRPIYLHKNANLIGCVYCNDPNVTKFDVIEAIGMSFRSAFEYISQCKKCNSNLVTLLRTFSPSHFENGSWNTGGSCNKTSPYNDRDHVGSYEWELRSTQVKEIERVRRLLLLQDNYNKKQLGKKFGVLDVTRAMLMRADGHPGAYWGNKWMKGYNDCVHWCLPGPIDLWNDFLMAILTNGSDLIL